MHGPLNVKFGMRIFTKDLPYWAYDLIEILIRYHSRYYNYRTGNLLGDLRQHY